MAYVKCSRCGLIAFTVAYWSSTDYCGRCGAQLPRPSSGATPISKHPRFLAGPRAAPSARGDDRRPSAA